MYFVKTPKVIQNLFPNFTWKVPTDEKVLYLTFDDGPNPNVTPWILEQLAAYNAKATFFCIGEQVEKHPEIFQQVIDANHSVGNHTFNHLSGWSSDNIPFFHNTRRCARLVNSSLFRPPYGRMKPKQVQFLQRHYRIIMWDVMSGDFDHRISNDKCLSNVVNNAEEGSIVVFHDSIKSKEKLQFVLPKVLEHYAALGYSFEQLNDQNLEKRALKIA
jgi:peptidoglycan/xylan/chitin deacetylase (PgdA/CDA1 family)